MSQKSFTLVVPPESPCGCGSGRAFGSCCLQGGQIRLVPKNLVPPPPTTGLSIKKCIFAHTSNCGGGISGDHIVSAAVLRQISTKKIAISGSGFSREHSIYSDALKVRRLCRRHNSALSPLDSEAGRLSRTVRAYDAALTGESALSLRAAFFNGLDIERWLLKTLLAAYHAKVSNVGPKTHQLPTHAMRLFEYQIAPPYGLYVPHQQTNGEQYAMHMERATSLYLITEGTRVAGIMASIAGLDFKFLLDGDPASVISFQEQHVFRPKFINFFQGQEVYCMAFGWREPGDKAIWLSRGRADAELPHGTFVPGEQPGASTVACMKDIPYADD